MERLTKLLNIKVYGTMKKLNFIIVLFVCLNGYSQGKSPVGTNHQEEIQAVTCEHFKQAHQILQKQGMSNYSQIVDYPILKYIHDTNQCKQLEEHPIDVNELKYFVFAILEHSSDQNEDSNH